MERFTNVIIGFLVGKLGVSMQGAEMLTVVGRKSGNPYTFPVNPLPFNNGLYLVSARGDANWVRNARAAGRVTLSRGRKARVYTVAEVTHEEEKVALLQAYLQRWSWQVQGFWHLSKNSSPAEIAARVDDFPMFRLSPA